MSKLTGNVIATQGDHHGALENFEIFILALLITIGEISKTNLYKTVKIQLRINIGIYIMLVKFY